MCARRAPIFLVGFGPNCPFQFCSKRWFIRGKVQGRGIYSRLLCPSNLEFVGFLEGSYLVVSLQFRRVLKVSTFACRVHGCSFVNPGALKGSSSGAGPTENRYNFVSLCTLVRESLEFGVEFSGLAQTDFRV